MNAHPAKVRARALRMLRAGKRSMADIARRTGVPRRTVQSWARRDGQEPRPPTPPPCTLPPAKQRKAVELYLADVTLRQITIRTGASPAQVRRLVRDAGHPLRTTHTKGRIDTQEAVALADELGVTAAARRLGCRVGSGATTSRRWARRSGCGCRIGRSGRQERQVVQNSSPVPFRGLTLQQDL